MADNIVTQTTVSTVPDGTRIATREGSYSGQTAHVAPVVLALASGSDDAKTISDVSNSAPVPVSDAGGSLTVDNGGTFAVQVSAALPTGGNTIGNVGVAGGSVGLLAGAANIGNVGLNAGTNNIGDVDVVTVPAPLSTTGGGTEATALRVTLANDSTGLVSVDDNGGSLTVDGTVSVSGTVTVGSHAVTNAGTFATQVTSLPASTNTIEVVGDAAHDAPVAGNPVLGGLEARTSDGTAVANGDTVRTAADTLGKQVVLIGAVNDLQLRGTANYTNTTASDLIAAQGAGIRTAVMAVLVTNAHATVATKVEIRDGTTVKILGYAAAVGGGFSWNGGGTPLFISTANTAVTARAVTTGSDCDVTVTGYRLAN